jgi:excisionase family DNA binding protein
MVNNELRPIAVSIHDAALMIGVSKRSVRHYAKSGQLQTAQVGRRVLVPVEALQAFIRANMVRRILDDAPTRVKLEGGR